MDEGSNKNKKDNFEFKVVRVKVSLNTGGMSDGCQVQKLIKGKSERVSSIILICKENGGGGGLLP